MPISTRAAGFAAMWLFIFACTSSPSSSSTSTSTSTSTGSTGSGPDAARSILDMFCNTVASPFCEANYACCATDQGRVGDNLEIDEATALMECKRVVPQGARFDVCRRWDGEEQDPNSLVSLLRAGMVVFDQAQFDTCLALLNSMTPGGAACVESPSHVLNTTCRSVFRGQLAPGDACPFEGDTFKGSWEYSALPCKAGRCEYGKCALFLKPGDACDLHIDQGMLYSNPAPIICNFLNKEVCWGDPTAGGAGGAGGAADAGGAAVMGTCRPQAELGEACNPANRHECRSFNCDTTGVCAQGSACTYDY